MFKGKSVLVTGGTGSIGSEIVRQLLMKDVENVIVFSRDEIKQYIMKQDINDPRLIMVMGDVRSNESVKSVFERHSFDIVFHTAAMKHLVVCENEPIECSNTNIFGTHNLIRQCVNSGVERVVTLSTDKAASPTSVMGSSKFIAERITLNGNDLSKSGQIFSCVRFGNVANSRGSVIPIMVNHIIKDEPIWISNPYITRFIMRISDAVELVLSTIDHSQGGEIFVLKMKSFTLKDLAKVMLERIGPRLGKDVELVKKKVMLGEKMHEDLLNKEEPNFLMENDNLYMILSREIMDREYTGFRKSEIESYDSSEVDMMTHDELEELILEHIHNILPTLPIEDCK